MSVSERGDVADWLGTGLQSPLIGFDSRRRLNCLVRDMDVPSSRDTDICKQGFLFMGR